MAQMQLQPPEMFDLYRAGLKSAADLMKASLENAERLQNQQLVAIRTAIVEQAKSASELSAARTMDELLACSTRMAGAQVERAIGMWSSLLQAAGESQKAWLNDVVGAQASLRPQASPQKDKEQQRKSA